MHFIFSPTSKDHHLYHFHNENGTLDNSRMAPAKTYLYKAQVSCKAEKPLACCGDKSC